MGSLLQTLFCALTGKHPRLVCAARVWDSGVAELKRRAAGQQESGAFLLGRVCGDTRVIYDFFYYDDIDPNCFANGIVEFYGRKLGQLWSHCRVRSMSVVADVHVHPGSFGQSESDQHNPIIAESGHFALILPDYATRRVAPGDIGVYEYRGMRRWRDHSRQGARIFHVGWWPK
jgi:hypothetical protein